MLSRPEPQSFTRFTISVAVFLAIAALVLPGLVLRETDVLRISERELAGLRPVAREELERRQEVARAAGLAAPFVGLAFLICAVGLAVYGLPRLKEQEEDEKERSSAELRKLLAEIRDQSDSEREEGLRADVEEDLPNVETRPRANGHPEEVSAPEAPETPPATVLPAEKPTGAPTPPSAPPPWSPVQDPSDGVRTRMRLAADVEDETLDRIKQLIGPRDQLLRMITIGTGYRLQLDGLLLPDDARKPDVLVEIKLSNRTGISRNTANRLHEQAGKLLAYRKHTGRAAVLWLILVADETVPQDVRDRALRRALEFEGDIHLTVVEKRELPDLTLPPID